MRIAWRKAVNRIVAKGRRLLLTDVSYNCGYSHQAHFIHDFKHFTGESPRKLIRDRDRYLVNPSAADPSVK